MTAIVSTQRARDQKKRLAVAGMPSAPPDLEIAIVRSALGTAFLHVSQVTELFAKIGSSMTLWIKNPA
jgi:hypothetical protein